jgi:hypothetical protein
LRLTVAEFDDLQEQVFALYVEQRFSEIRELLDGAVERFPKWRSRITYWQSCVDSLLGDSEQAVERLRRGAKDGMFWPENSLHTDPDLAAVRGQPGFKEMLGEVRRSAKLANENPPPATRGPAVRARSRTRARPPDRPAHVRPLRGRVRVLLAVSN